MIGLKPIYGGSIPPFLVSGIWKGWLKIFRSLVKLVELGRRQALRMCDKEEGSRVVILHSLL